MEGYQERRHLASQHILSAQSDTLLLSARQEQRLLILALHQTGHLAMSYVEPVVANGASNCSTVWAPALHFIQHL